MRISKNAKNKKMNSVHFFNKKAMELAINFIVMLILGMAIFGVGIYFATNVFNKTSKIGSDLDQQTKTTLENKLRDSSLPVAFGKTKEIVKKGENVKFGLGIANTDKEEKTFTVSVSCAMAAKNNEALDLNEFPCPPTPKDKDIKIDGKSYETTPLLFVVNKDTKSATYVYNVIVTENGAEDPDEAYGGLQKLYIDVK